MLVVQLLSQKLDDGEELVGGRDLEDILLHDWRISDSSKPDNNFGGVFAFVVGDDGCW